MTLHADDPRLTAYVLGELNDDERAEFERELTASPEAERELAEIRETVALVRRELMAEPLTEHGIPAGLCLDDAARLLDEVPTPSATSQEWNSHLGWRVTSYVAAAALLVVVGYFTVPRGELALRQDVAMRRLNESIEPAQSQQFPWGFGDTNTEGQRVHGIPASVPALDKSISLTPSQSATGAQDLPRAPLSLGVGGQISSSGLQRSDWGVEELSELGLHSNLNDVSGKAAERNFAYTIGKPVNQQLPWFNEPVTTYGVDQLQRRTTLQKQFENPSMMVVPQILMQEEEEQLRELPLQNTEAYAPIVENPFLAVLQNPLSTFSIDVDTASYSNVRRFLTSGTLPPPGAVRIEEMVNYFTYHYAPPAEGDTAPFAAHLEVAECPWRPEHRLVRVGLKGREIASEDRPASNLVFLLDVSGSMDEPNKLPLVKEGLRMLVNGLRENDRVAIVVYAGASGLVLDSTSGDNKETILAAIDELSPGGSTNGASGIQLAYDVAAKHFIKEGTNRVILATDGDFNVGITDESQLVKLIEDQAKTGVFLSVLGFGMGNLKDSTLEQLADRGNGNYAYVDSDREARKVLVDQLSGTLVTIAKDVKIQVEFNPARVAAYRLIGYENRMLTKEDFNDDTKDAGEIGAGHTVTALYEVLLTASAEKMTEGDTAATEVAKENELALEREVDELEYLTVARPTDAALASPNLLTLKLRYKEPEGTKSKLLKFPVEDAERRIGEASTDFQLAASVAAFGMLLRGSEFAGSANMDAIMEWAQSTLSDDPEGYRRELVDLMRTARELAKAQQQSRQQPSRVYGK